MTDEDGGVYDYANGMDLYKDNESQEIWWVQNTESIGEFLFTFDKKTVFNFFQDYPDKLTPEQIAIFKKENPDLAALK